MTNPTPEQSDPAAVYLYIYNRLRECQAMGEKLPSAEASILFTQLMYACSALISRNDRLETELYVAQGIIEELEIEICVKDIEIYNFTTQSDQKDD